MIGANAQRTQMYVRSARTAPFPLPITHVVETLTLEVKQVLSGDGLRKVVPTPDGRYAVGVAQGLDLRRAGVLVVDLAANRMITSVGTGASVHVAVAAAPLAPVMVAPEVSAGTVRVAWSLLPHSPSATEYLLEAGSRPGLSDLGTMPVSEASLTIPNVPSGTYYVRVKGSNFAGVGSPSADVIVVVP